MYLESPTHRIFQDQISLHSVDGTLTTNGGNLYRVIDGMTDEQLFTDGIDGEEESEGTAEPKQNENGKLIEKEKAETGNVSKLLNFQTLS